MAGWAGPPGAAVDPSDLDGMAVPGLPTSDRCGAMLAQGDAWIERGREAGARMVDGRIEQAVADVSPRRVVLRRDPIGLRPLYYACSRDRRTLAWASRPTQLAALGWVDASADWEGILDVLSASPTFDPARTCITGIRQVPPGHRIEWEPGRVRVVKQWDPADHVWDGGRGPRRPAAEFAALLVDAVGRRADDRTGILLSGGIDSPSVAAAAVRGGLRPRTLSSVFPRHPSVDESGRIREVHARLGLDGDLVAVDDRGLEPADELALHGEPHVAPNHGHMVGLLREAARLGHGTLLDGHDGDGALGPMHGLGRHLATRPRLARDVLRYAASVGIPRAHAVRVLASELAPAAGHAVYGRVRHRRTAQAVAELQWAGPGILEWGEAHGHRPSWRDNQLRSAGPNLARSVVMLDRMAAAHGLHLAHPFADQGLLEFLLGLPPQAKHLHGRSKGLAREGFSELPSVIRDQGRKTAFNAAAEASHPLEALAPLVLDPRVPVPGVDYDALRRRVVSGGAYQPGEMGLLRRLALTHRFLALRAR